MSELMSGEQGRLAELEQTIAAGLTTFVEVGLALREIRDEHLYRKTHDTFEAYLDERWSISRPRGYQLIDAARVVELVSTTVDTVPANEAQARQLAPLLDEPELLTDAWKEAVHITDGNPTATTVAEVVNRRRMTDEDRAHILALRADGKSQTQIAEITGWSQAAVSRFIRASASDLSKLPRRRQPASPQTVELGKLQRACREWDALGDEEYIPAPEIARRIRVLDQVATFVTRKRAHYYARTGRSR